MRFALLAIALMYGKDSAGFGWSLSPSLRGLSCSANHDRGRGGGAFKTPGFHGRSRAARSFLSLCAARDGGARKDPAIAGSRRGRQSSLILGAPKRVRRVGGGGGGGGGGGSGVDADYCPDSVSNMRLWRSRVAAMGWSNLNRVSRNVTELFLEFAAQESENDRGDGVDADVEDDASRLRRRVSAGGDNAAHRSFSPTVGDYNTLIRKSGRRLLEVLDYMVEDDNVQFDRETFQLLWEKCEVKKDEEIEEEEYEFRFHVLFLMADKLTDPVRRASVGCLYLFFNFLFFLSSFPFSLPSFPFARHFIQSLKSNDDPYRTPRLQKSRSVIPRSTISKILSAFVKGCARRHELDLAMFYLHRMEDMDLRVHERIYRSVVLSCCRICKGQVEDCPKCTLPSLECIRLLLQSMRERQVTPSSVTYSSAISAAGHSGNYRMAEATLIMAEQDKNANEWVYGSMLSVCKKVVQCRTSETPPSQRSERQGERGGERERVGEGEGVEGDVDDHLRDIDASEASAKGLVCFREITKMRKVHRAHLNDIIILMTCSPERYKAVALLRDALDNKRTLGGWGSRLSRRQGDNLLIDTHGFNPDVAKIITIWGLNKCYELGNHDLVVIVGKGKGAGVPVVAEEVIDFLLGDLGLIGKIDEGNFGRVLISRAEVEKSVEETSMWLSG